MIGHRTVHMHHDETEESELDDHQQSHSCKVADNSFTLFGTLIQSKMAAYIHSFSH